MLKKEKLAIVRKYYPNAITTIDNVNKIIDYIEDQLNLQPSHVMLADSICSDDVNSIQYPSRASEFLGPFKLGGLDGYPFAGLTGMGAFASHVPDNGAVFIYYGPHIGITKEGVIGEVNRYGQHKSTGCCGAAKAALNKLNNNEIVPGSTSELDYQMNAIEQIVYNQKTRVLNSKFPIQEASEVIYEATNQRINELVSKTNYKCKYVILMGAILINGDTDMGSFSATKRFELIDLSSGVTTDLMSWL